MSIDKIQDFPEDWSLLEKINFLQRKIILNSILYYHYDQNALSDHFYDRICRQLVQLHEEYGDISDTEYGYVFYDFEGSTGYHLFNRLTIDDKDYLMLITEIYLSSKQ